MVKYRSKENLPRADSVAMFLLNSVQWGRESNKIDIELLKATLTHGAGFRRS
jgi:hypothetical protein